MYVLQDSDGTIYPADRCTWSERYSDARQQYIILSPQFYGLGATPTDLDDSEARLGYIGKSGRFVGISK